MGKVTLSNVKKSFGGVEVLHDINLDIKKMSLLFLWDLLGVGSLPY